MKKQLLIFFFSTSFLIFGQQKSSKKITTTLKSIEILTEGIDEVLIENSEDNNITIYLDDENIGAHAIITKEEANVLKINFQTDVEPKEEVFRKFITKRLNRASVKIKIPKEKNITFLGTEIDIISKNYQGNYSIFIEKGTLKFNTIHGDIQISLFSGNIFGVISEGKINLTSTKGKIKIDSVIKKKSFKKTLTNSERNFKVNSILANISLSTKKTQ